MYLLEVPVTIFGYNQEAEKQRCVVQLEKVGMEMKTTGIIQCVGIIQGIIM